MMDEYRVKEPLKKQVGLRRNLTVTLWLSYFQGFLLIMPIAVPFFQSKGLSMQEVFSLQAAFSLAVLLLEVPSGLLADLFGRRLTLIWGTIFCGFGSSALMVAQDFWGLLAFELLLAVSHSLVSGADLAMAYDSELALGRQAEQQRSVVGRLYAARNYSEACASVLLSGLLLWLTIQEVLLVQALISWLPLVFALQLVEPPRAGAVGDKGDKRGQTGKKPPLGTALRHLWRHSTVLRFCFLALCLWTLTTFNAVWLLQKLWTLQSIELVHFGYLWAALSLVTALAGRFSDRIEASMGTAVTLTLLGVLPVVGYLLLEQPGVLAGLLAAVLFFAARGMGLVILRDALNRRTPSAYRATANSLASFGFRAAFVLTGPFVGYAYDLWGMRTVLLWSAGVSALIAVVILLPLALAARQPRPVGKVAAAERLKAISD